jgi:hypothetical protein
MGLRYQKYSFTHECLARRRLKLVKYPGLPNSRVALWQAVTPTKPLM